jgi:glycosyltransferase involved in cell wall biosynthesis
MRIGMLADVYKPYVSGVTNHISLTKKYLEKAGHEVFVFTFGDKDYEDDEPNVIRSSGLPLNLPVADIDVQLNVRFKWEAQELLHSMDVVHVHHPLISGRLALRYCKIRGIPIIFTNHTRYDLYTQAYFPWMPEAVGETFLRSYLPSFFRSVDMALAPSKGMQEILYKLGVETPVEIVPNGVDLSRIQNVDEPIDRAKLGYTKDHIVLIYVGRLGPEKNLPFLLHSFYGVTKAYENVRLLALGKGPDHDKLEEQAKSMGIEDHVQFTGLIPYEEIPKYLLMADIFVTPSVSEAHPLTVIEAMAAGLPVMGIESPGVGDMVVDGRSGFLAPNDIAAFTAKMIRIVTDHKLRLKMEKAARKDAEAFAIERTSKLLLEKYQEVIDRKKKQKQPWITDVVKSVDKLLDDPT